MSVLVDGDQQQVGTRPHGAPAEEMEMTTQDLQRELEALKGSYAHELDILGDRLATAKRTNVSSHEAFNMSATCQNLAVLAGKIEQTANVIRWMEAK